MEALRNAVHMLVVDNGALNRMEDGDALIERIMRSLADREELHDYDEDDLPRVNEILSKLTQYELEQIVLLDEAEETLVPLGISMDDIITVDQVFQSAFEAI